VPSQRIRATGARIDVHLSANNTERIRIQPVAVADELRREQPGIELHPATGDNDRTSGLPVDKNTIVVGVWMLQPGEDLIVAQRLCDVLTRFVVQD